ncbi:2'-5' RNA ligase family protein [Rhodoferax ferrireducens]|uniref:2'-5' RNA ligase family protein n=1 Tax=Rhodoferax ferrireducens TaxID=192843 RepID=UPI000E0D2BEF|nr:2'-5' RNA ligase family protein [Rhodoferax ferrireducens]
MFDQSTLPGFEGAPSGVPPSAKVSAKVPRGRAPHTLFFAIFPDADAAKAIAIQAAHLGRAHGLVGQPLLAHRLHVTLHDLGGYGELPPDMVKTAREAGDAVAAPAFDVVFDRAMSFPSSRTYVLCGGAGIAQLTAFRQSLGLAMGHAGLPVKRSFTPHMTVLYDRHPIAEHATEPITWTAKEFVLVNSHVGKGVHEVLGRWSLRA